MRVDLRIAGLSFALLLAPSMASAQRCVGTTSLRSAPARVGVSAEFADGATSYGVNLMVGSAQGLFGTAGLSAIDYDGTDERSTMFSVGGGYVVPMGTTGRVEFCPVAGFSLIRGPDFREGSVRADVSGRSVSFGGTIGGVASTSPTMEFVPFAGAVYFNERVTVEASGGPFGGSVSGSNDGVNLTAGAGFVVNRVLTIAPSLSRPIGVDGADVTFGISFSYSFGASRSGPATRR